MLRCKHGKNAPVYERSVSCVQSNSRHAILLLAICTFATVSLRVVDVRRNDTHIGEVVFRHASVPEGPGVIEVDSNPTKAESEGPDQPLPSIDDICKTQVTLAQERSVRSLQQVDRSGPRQRIALYTGAYNHIRDGVSLTLNRLVEYLLDQGHEVLVLAPTTSHPVMKHAGTMRPVPSVRFPGRHDYRLSLALTHELKSKLVDFRPTIVHIATPDVVGFQVQSWAASQDVPVACSFHTHFTSYLSYYNLGFLKGFTWDVLRNFYKSCNHTYVPSYGIADELRSHGLDAGLLLWTRGVDTAFYRPERRCPALRKELGIADDEPVVLLACRLVWEKGLRVYVDVVQRLEAAGIKHKSVVAGDGPAKARMKQLLPNTVFLGDQTPQQLACAYASADVYLFPSNTETFGVTTLEAMSSGLPVVVANASGPAMMVDHGENGFMAPPADSKTFYRFTKALLLDPKMRSRMSKAGRDIAFQKFHWAEVFGNLVQHYSKLVPSTEAKTN